jgi:beta-N-acetylhexosaminidase
VDALCVGGETTEPDVLEEMIDAIEAAVVRGQLSYGRLAEAASRVGKLGRWVRDTRRRDLDEPVSGSPRDVVEVRAARQAVLGRGVIALNEPALVLELQDDPSLAAGPVPWGVGAHIAERLPGTVVASIWESGPAPGTVLARYPNRPIVISVRDLRSRPWQKDMVNLVREHDPNAIVVDHGMPEPGTFEEPYVLTYGASRVAAATAADLICGASSAAGRAGA